MSRLSNSPGALLSLAEDLASDTSGAMQVLRLGTSVPITTAPGSGANSSDNFSSRVTLETTGLRKTEILVDIDGLVSASTDNDVIGDAAGAANAHIGQVLATQFGTVLGGTILCLQAPATGELDIDLYSNSSGTIAQSANGTGGTALLEVGTNWTVGLFRAMSGVPTANHYLYLTVGTNSTPTAGTYTAGIFLLTFYGV